MWESSFRAWKTAWVVSGVILLLSCGSDGNEVGCDESNGLSVKRCTDVSEDTLLSLRADELFTPTRLLDLAESISTNDVDRLRYELDTNFDVDSSGLRGATLLFWALREHSYDSLVLLLEKGANPNMYVGDRSIVHWAAADQDTRFLTAMLEAGGDPNLFTRDDLGSTPLISALVPRVVEDKHPSIEALLVHGADPNLQTKAGLYPLLFAATGNHFNAVYQMLEAGADPTVTTSKGRNIHSLIAFKETRLLGNSPNYQWLVRVKELLAELDA